MSALDILRHQTLPLPMMHVEEFPARQSHRVRKGTPEKVLERGDVGRGVGDRLALRDLRVCGLRLPEVRQGKYHVGAGEGGGECVAAAVQVGAVELGSKLSQGFCSWLFGVAREGSDVIGFWMSKELSRDGASLR